MIAILLLGLLSLVSPQQIVYSVLPTSVVNLTQASPSACYANCRSCQTLTNQCEQCFDPYFVKAQDGSCQLADNYTLESSTNEVMAGSAFIYTSDSWGTQPQTDCQPDNSFLDAPLRIIGPFSAGTPVSYQRTVSIHQYVVLRFQLIKMGWTNSSTLSITLSDQNNRVFTSQTIKHTPNVAQQTLCSATQIDQRFSVLFQVPDRSITTIYANFTFSGSGSWGVATWALITGLCDSTCSNCTFSGDPTACIGCNSFFIMGSDSRCSQCYTGFQKVDINGIESCLKCQIEYQNCNAGQQLCYYSYLDSQLNRTDCTFLTTSEYTSNYDVDNMQFPGSLFTVDGKPATEQCGTYSVVGPAQSGDAITRIFVNMQLHYQISITFNVFLVDQTSAITKNLFVVILDNVILQANYVNTQGISNLCGDAALLEAFVTYPASKFYSHTKNTNVNLTITSNATNWGIRNLRLAFQVCDQTCLNCNSTYGCVECSGYFTLQDLKCTGCPAGFGISSINQTNTCIQCPQNCLTCTASQVKNATVTTCLECSQPFFLFENNCVKKTNVADTIPITAGGSSGNSSQNGTWNVQSSPTVANNSCTMNLPSRSNTSKVNFTVSQNNMSSLLYIPQVHYIKIVQFNLIKIDKWEPTDLLQLYLNDLLVMSKNYTSFGNSICFSQTETDLISFESIKIEDSNNSLSVSFEVVSAVGTVRRFGVANFQVFPVGCQQCQDYPFKYKIDYNYDSSLNVHVEFNRVYANSNSTLFNQIFWLLIDGNKVDYSVIWNNSVTYILQAFPASQALNSNLTVVCKYSQLVQTDTQDTVSDKPFFTTRLLSSPAYQNLKVIDNNASYQSLVRYTPPSSSINGIRIFFDVVSRAVIYIGFAMFFFGCQTSCTHFMHNLQKIWLHIFVAALAAPSALRYALTGFREVQGQNIAVHPSSWESGLPLQLYYNTHSYFEQYYTDVGFFRNVYNIAVAFLILGVISIIFNLVLGRCNFSRNFKDNVLWRHLRVTFVKRPYFIFNSIIFYQYLTLVLACTLQFTAIMNETNQGSYGGVNAAAAIITFVIATIYPLAHFYYMQKKKTSMEEAKIEYANRYGEIFYRFLPRDVWVQDSIGITYGEQIYNVFRFGQLWWFCIIATLLSNSPQGQCYLLMITNLIHLVLVLFTKMSKTFPFKLLKVFQLAFFTGLQIIILVCQSSQQTLTSRSLNTLGSVSIALLFAIILLSFFRSVYTFIKIYQQYYPQPEMNKYTNIKTRNEEYFSTKADEPLPSQRD